MTFLIYDISTSKIMLIPAWTKLKVLLWKNFVLRKRYLTFTILEIIFPPLLIILLQILLLEYNITKSVEVENETYNPFRCKKAIYKMFDKDCLVLYTPTNYFATKVMTKVQDHLNIDNTKLQSFKNEELLNDYLKQHRKDIEKVIVVIFKHKYDYLARKLNYVIRPYAKDVFWETHSLYVENEKIKPGLGSYNYIHHGFIPMQLAIDMSYLDILNLVTAEICVQEFPYPAYAVKNWDALEANLPGWIFAAYLIFFAFSIHRVLDEKKYGIKELMTVMGVQSWLLWIAILLELLIISIISVLLITCSITRPAWKNMTALIQHSTISVIFFFLLLYLLATYAFCLAISSFFSRPITGDILGVFLLIISYSVPSNIIHSGGLSALCKMLLLLLPNSGLIFGFRAISLLEKQEIGIHWNHTFRIHFHEMSMGIIYTMFVVDTILYTVITFYMNKIHSGPHGNDKPLCFPLKNLYYNFFKKKEIIVKEDANSFYKKEDAPNMVIGLRTKRLYKRFGKTFVLSNISIDIYKGQITALLGQNGAGKTTLLSIISGMLGSSSGQVFIERKNVIYNKKRCQRLLGVCPQEDLLYPALTLYEHLVFFGTLKDLTVSTIQNAARTLLKKLNCYNEMDYLVRRLSTATKRKLSFAIAVIGSPNIILLDEPTVGIDPESRRLIWDVIVSLRDDRSIIISTNNMEEAEAIGDRIAILNHGRLICYGTSLFLKKEFGTGYKLQITLGHDFFGLTNLTNVLPLTTRHDAITKIVRNMIPDTTPEIHNNIITYYLPYESKPVFGKLLNNLTKVSPLYKINNVDLKLTTLEEVFIKVDDIISKRDAETLHLIELEEDNEDLFRDEDEEDYMEATNESIETHENEKPEEFKLPQRPSGCKNLKIVFLVLLLKRFWIEKRQWFLPIIEILLLIFITWLTLFLSDSVYRMHEIANEDNLLDLNLNIYPKSRVFYSGKKSFYSHVMTYEEFASEFTSDLHHVSSVSDELLKEGRNDFYFYKRHIIVSAEFNLSIPTLINAMYSTNALHSAPISLNLATNALTRMIGCKIDVANNPLPQLSEDSFKEMSEINTVVYWSILLPIGLLLYCIQFLVVPQQEVLSSMQKLEIMSGVRPVLYWITFFIWDYMIFLLGVCAMFVVLVTHGATCNNIFNGSDEKGPLFCIVLAYGVSMLGYIYLCSTNQKPINFLKFAFTVCTNSYIMALILVVIRNTKDIFTIASYLFDLFPQFGLLHCLYKYSLQAVRNYNFKEKLKSDQFYCVNSTNPCCVNVNSTACVEHQSYFYGENGILIDVLIMLFSGILYFFILFIFQRKLNTFRDWMKNLLIKKNHDSFNEYDDDVEEESQRALGTYTYEKTYSVEAVDDYKTDLIPDLILAYRLQKQYGNRIVVDELSFGIKSKECLGILGVDGAGKTTIFRLLTGDLDMFEGDARIYYDNKFYYISHNLRQYLEFVAYCPQTNVLIPLLTGYEMLYVMAKLRGLDASTRRVVKHWIKMLGLENDAKKLCKYYSGGNKRKLSFGVALIGTPLVIMLDEPTLGVDPVSRHKLWNIVRHVQRHQSNPAIILSSQSMDECETLCDRICILKDGQLKCFGTLSNLRNKYNKGYTVFLKLKLNVKPGEYESKPTSKAAKKLNDKKIRFSIKEIYEDPEHAEGKTRPIEIISPLNELEREYSEIGPKPDDDSLNLTKLAVEAVIEDFQELYQKQCILADKQSGILRYRITDTTKSLGTIFNDMHNLQEKHFIIEDYHVMQTTLEEIFLSITQAV